MWFVNDSLLLDRVQTKDTTEKKRIKVKLRVLEIVNSDE